MSSGPSSRFLACTRGAQTPSAKNILLIIQGILAVFKVYSLKEGSYWALWVAPRLCPASERCQCSPFSSSLLRSAPLCCQHCCGSLALEVCGGGVRA